MGNCLDASARVDNGQSFQTTSGASKSSSKASPSTPSSWAVPSYCNKTTAESLPTPRSEGEILSSPNLKAFSFSKLKNATRNFHPSSLIKQGGFGYVFKGWIDEKTLAAVRPGSGMIITVKKLKSEGVEGHKEWVTEVNLLGQLHHPNLVELIGYCIDSENRLLVYEFMSKGSLDYHLCRKRAEALSWAIRIKVAIGAARGLSFLHDAESQVIHHDFAAYSILLDAEFNAKLSNFCLAKADPTGQLSAKSDVYSFGVVLLELLSGRQAVDGTLEYWEKPYLGEKHKLFQIMDTKLEGQYPRQGAYVVAILALKCLSTEAKDRPRMVDVLETLEQLQAQKMR